MKLNKPRSCIGRGTSHIRYLITNKLLLLNKPYYYHYYPTKSNQTTERAEVTDVSIKRLVL